ncbi:hypothetical protein N7520_003472 [Penicillium odoratum]|uniref:uncharacterized protein n=1 Tax=Penicillium odoratum TaxID=1167516 RepID=UPI0025489730|nr:uncharacterized protein N7520_003472 [Penicillium odoratum]KAJ5768913.1 hypothetical protein N7520_003472 [Penicillium odoratum]
MPGQVFQPIDVVSLESYICKNLPRIERPIWVTQLGYDQSSPTYFIKDGVGKKLVMRKRLPAPAELKNADTIEREYRVLCALKCSKIPVPKPYCFCEDPSIIGAPFFIMESLQGRTFEDQSLPGVSPRERHQMWREIITTLAQLHILDINTVGLNGFGRRGGFFRQQVWNLKHCEEIQRAFIDFQGKKPIGKVPGVEEIVRFLSDEDHQPRDRSCLIHGDFKINNIIFHKTEPRIIGILSWEMSTIGHPLVDLANLFQARKILEMSSSAADTLSLPSQSAATIMGLPSVSECLAWYSEVAGWNPQAEMMWADAFALFQMSVLRQGMIRSHVARQSGNSVVDTDRGISH